MLIFNPAAERILKYRAADLLKKQPPDSLLPSEFLSIATSEGGSCVLPETAVTASDGEEVPIRFSGISLRQNGDFIGRAAFLQDLREIKQLEREKIEAERFAAVGQTVAGLSHGIKNILTGLEGAMYVFNTGLKKSDQGRIDEGWAMLNRNIEKISALAKKLLDFSKSRIMEVALTDPKQIVTDVVALFQETAARHGVELQSDLGEDVQSAPLDAGGIHECLTNLVSNAIDACTTSGKAGCRVSVRCREANGSLVFEVEDSGCGMDAETRKCVFTNFFTTKGAGGTGLGLLITRRIVQEHGGTIAMESSPGKGSLFRLTFPRDQLPQPTRS
jgi:PAS domain S-box-containing protein